MTSSTDWEQAKCQRKLTALQQLLSMEATALPEAIREAAQLASEALGADDVDLFCYESESESLIALGAVDTQLGRRRRELGLDRLPLAGGGRLVEVFRVGQHYRGGRADRDPAMLPGFVEDLGVRSCLYLPLEIRGERRGVLLVDSTQPEAFSEADLRFAEAIVDWLALVAHRAELIEQSAREAGQRGHRQSERDRLSPREREVATLIAQGLTNEQIGERLSITSGTAARHIENILEKLGLDNRAQVAVWAAAHGLFGRRWIGD